MANKTTKKNPLNKDCLLEALAINKTSIRKLDLDHDFVWSASTINRAIRNGASETLLDDLGRHLDVDPDYLSGKYHNQIKKIADRQTRKVLLSSIDIKKYPYIKKLQRSKIDGNFIYGKMLEYLLISHNISMSQLDSMSVVDKAAFQIELESAIADILIKHFNKDCIGNKLYPEIYNILGSIESYYSDEPEESDD